MVHCSKYVKAGLDEHRLLRKRYLQRQKALMKYDKMTLRICIKNGRAYYYGRKKGRKFIWAVLRTRRCAESGSFGSAGRC